MPNGTGIVTGFPQILSDAPTVKAALRRSDPRPPAAARRGRTGRGRPRPSSASPSNFPQIQAARCVALYAVDRHRAPDRAAAPGAAHAGHRRRAPAGARPRRPRLGLGHRGRARAPAPGPAVGEPAGPHPRPARAARRRTSSSCRRSPSTPSGPGSVRAAATTTRALPLLDPGVPILAVVHDDEVLDAAVEALPAEPHDVPVDGALTPLRCLRLPGRA